MVVKNLKFQNFFLGLCIFNLFFCTLSPASFNEIKFCKHPYSQICSSAAEKKMEQIQENFEKQVIFKAQIGLKQDLSFNVFNLKIPLFDKEFEHYAKLVEKYLFEYSGLKTKDFQSIFNQVKNDFINQINISWWLNFDQKAKLAAKIVPIKMVMAADYVRWNSSRVRKVCGPKLEKQNAFFKSYFKNSLVVVLCPAMLALSEKAQESASDRLWYLYETIAHEIAHAIDYDEFPSLYHEWKKCTADFQGLLLDDDQASELVADRWATHLLLNRIQQYAITQDQANRLWQKAYFSYCDGNDFWDDNNSHLPSVVRVNYNLTKTFKWAMNQGCINKSALNNTHFFCELYGRVK